MDGEAIKAAVREYYARRVSSGSCCGAAEDGADCCGTSQAAAETSCCGSSQAGAEGRPHVSGDDGTTRGTGDIEEIPSYGCGTPFEADLFQRGDIVVDLGSGPGRDALGAALAVGPAGRVIGVDMTTEMIDRARAAASRAGLRHIEFRLGDIETLPVAGGAADLVISNCVLTLVPDKRRALSEAFRILRTGGRLVVNDIVAKIQMPDVLRRDLQLWSACVSGAITEDEYRELLEAVGFVDITIVPDGGGVGALPTFSARVTARKP